MLKTIATSIAAATLVFTAAPALAQDEAEQPRTTYMIEFLKFAPGADERWTEMGEKYWGPAQEASGLPAPQIHWLVAGEWDIMMVFEMPRGMTMLDTHMSPERKAFREAVVKIAGSEEEAKKLMNEDDKLIADSMRIFSHTHP